MADTGRRKTIRQKMQTIQRLSGWTQGKIAVQIGVSRQVCGHYFTGEVKNPMKRNRNQINALYRHLVEQGEKQKALDFEAPDETVEETPMAETQKVKTEGSNTRQTYKPGWLGISRIGVTPGLLDRIQKKTGLGFDHVANLMDIPVDTLDKFRIGLALLKEAECFRFYWCASALNWFDGKWPEKFPTNIDTRYPIPDKFFNEKPKKKASNDSPTESDVAKLIDERDQMIRERNNYQAQWERERDNAAENRKEIERLKRSVVGLKGALAEIRHVAESVESIE